jgi:hypothetical protein
LYGCETWSLISREEHKLRVLENRVLRMMCGPKRNETTAERVRLRGALCSVLIIEYYSGNQVKKRVMGVTCSTYGRQDMCTRGIDLGTLGKRPLERPRSKWVGNIKMDMQEVGWRGMGWSYLVLDMDRWRVVVNAVMNLRAP